MRKLYSGLAVVGLMITWAVAAEKNKGDFETAAARNAKTQIASKVEKAEKDF